MSHSDPPNRGIATMAIALSALVIVLWVALSARGQRLQFEDSRPAAKATLQSASLSKAP